MVAHRFDLAALLWRRACVCFHWAGGLMCCGRKERLVVTLLHTSFLFCFHPSLYFFVFLPLWLLLPPCTMDLFKHQCYILLHAVQIQKCIGPRFTFGNLKQYFLNRFQLQIRLLPPGKSSLGPGQDILRWDSGFIHKSKKNKKSLKKWVHIGMLRGEVLPYMDWW